MIRRPPRSTQGVSSAASDVYKRQLINTVVQNDRIAAEVVVDRVSADGQAFEQRIAIFLTFDDDGKIITDHTYAGTTNLEALVPYLPEDGQKALKAIIENQ